ncbi:MAG: ribonuclease J [Defluviitaleaceae bacterium]|nr:ribonuclease J [Defluviitaleaceae bacterium]
MARKIKSRGLAHSGHPLKVFSLGGLQEIGKNVTVLEYGDDIMMIDCGVAFPDDDLLGIDLVIPDFSYLVKNKDRLRGVVLTHGHEDHIGAIPYFLREFGDVPIYATRLTLGLMENKLREHRINAESHCVKQGETIRLGCFEVEFISITHSIADAVALAVKTPAGMVIHSGDFKIDYTPIHGKPMDLQRFAELGRNGVLLFMCESTNVEQKGYTMSERSVGEIFEKIFEGTGNQRIMVATFSSNIHRIQQVINSAVKHKRKVNVMGRSMANAVRTASELGYLDIPPHTVIEAGELKNYTDGQVAIIMTGSQGEPMAALSRMASSGHKQMEIKPGDRIVISASPIPGNEKTISKVIDDLMKKGADVIYEGHMDVHVSGHAKQEEIKLMHALVKPKYLIPVHGEYRHLIYHKQLAVSLGMDKDNIFIMNIGDVLEFSGGQPKKIAGAVPSGQVLVDGLGVGDVGNVVLRDRKHLSQDGLIMVVLTMCRESGQLLSRPELISRGFVYVKEAEDLLDQARTAVAEALAENDGAKSAHQKNVVRETLREFVWQSTKRSPMIIPVIMEV